jgi:hypothetical protein
MHLVDGVNTLIADDAAGFAARVVRLYQEEALWSRLVAQQRQTLLEFFSQTRLDQTLAEFLQNVALAQAQTTHVQEAPAHE